MQDLSPPDTTTRDTPPPPPLCEETDLSSHSEEDDEFPYWEWKVDPGEFKEYTFTNGKYGPGKACFDIPPMSAELALEFAAQSIERNCSRWYNPIGHLFEFSVENRLLGVLVWLLREKNMSRDFVLDAFFDAALDGKLHAAEVIYRWNNITFDEMKERKLFSRLAKAGHVRVMYWLVVLENVIPDDQVKAIGYRAFQVAEARGKVVMVWWMRKRGWDQP